jgi:hypothetical protein
MLPALKIALLVTALASLGVAAWANSRMMRRSRDAGYRYWIINPMSAIAGLRGIEPLVFIAAILLGVAAMMGIVALK